MSSISVKNLSKRFGDTIALKDLSIDVSDREFLVMVGPTGAGKTTTLRCLAGLDKPDGGTVAFGGEDMTAASPAARDVAFVFQNYALYPRKSVYENIAFPLHPRGYSKEQIDREVKRVAQMLRITRLLDRTPAQLSGGEQQRVALGRAMVRTPRAFLMDEPLTNLDFQLRAQMRSELKRIQRDLNATFFYVTNDQVEALSMGDRIAVLHQGQIQQIGTPQAIYETPANLFVAGFIGSTRMNFLKCAYNADAGALVNQQDGWELPIPEPMRQRASQSQNSDQLILGIRPEDMQVTTGNDGEWLRGQVYVVEPFGDRNVFDVRLGSSLVKVKMPPSYFLDPETPVGLKFELSCLHLFDALNEHILN